jgi:hypothetical protein
VTRSSCDGRGIGDLGDGEIGEINRGDIKDPCLCELDTKWLSDGTGISTAEGLILAFRGSTGGPDEIGSRKSKLSSWIGGRFCEKGL